MNSLPHNQRPSEWRRLFAIARDLIEQVQIQTGGLDFDYSFGGGTAMMLQIGHRESHDVDLFVDDPQLLGFLDPEKADLRFKTMPSEYGGDGARFQKFTFAELGEIDIIVARPLSSKPFEMIEIDGQSVKIETVAEIITKKVYHRGGEAKARDIFDIAAAAQTHRAETVTALRAYPDQVGQTLSRLAALNPEFVLSTISQLMIKPEYRPIVPTSLATVDGLLREALEKGPSLEF